MKEKNIITYNGLDCDLKTFAKFIHIYEAKIKKMSRKDEFDIISKKAKEYFEKTLKNNIHQIKSNKKKPTQEIANRGTLIFKKRDAIILNFCRHLRNSFCHAKLKKEKSELHIKDCYKGVTSCSGYLNYGDVKEFLILTINDFEDKL